MKLTKNQTEQATLTALYRAKDRQHPITITYTKADGTETLRTIEIYDIRTTKNGDVILRAMDRTTSESRTFRVDRIVAYTIHRTAYVVPRDQPAATPAAPASASALIALELGRDERPARRHLTPAA